MRGQVSIASGSIYPDGLPMTEANPDIQKSVRPEGSYFAKSIGYESIRPGRTRYQHSHGMGIHFTPLRLAEDITQLGVNPVMVDVTTGPDHADVADIPGSAELGPGGVSDVRNRILIGESDMATPEGAIIRHRGTKTLPDMGDREPHRPLSSVFHGFADPVEMFQTQYAKNPTVAVGAAAVAIGVIYMIARDFERSYRARSATARRGGGVTATAAPVAAAPAAAADSSGNTVEKVADSAAEVVEAAGDGVAAVVETAGSTVEKVTETAADAVTD